MSIKRQLQKQRAGAIKYWKARKKRYQFVRQNLAKILKLSTKGWPRIFRNPDYLAWVDIAHKAKSKGLYSYKTALCDIAINLKAKALEIKKAKTLF